MRKRLGKIREKDRFNMQWRTTGIRMEKNGRKDSLG